VVDERRVLISSEPQLSPEEVARRTFGTVFRGFDPTEVRNYLRRVSDELGVARERQRHVEHLLADAQSRSNAPPPPLDEATLTAALGEETARVLQTAREASIDIKAKAQENVERLLRQAHEDAARIREEAQGIFAVHEAEAIEAAEAIRNDAQADADAVRAHAQAESAGVVEAARERAREMLEEAKEIRAKVLGDVVRRRNVARVQVAQLRAGRERLLDAYRVVRETLDHVTVELGRAEDEARVAAEAAGQKAGAELAGDAAVDVSELDPELLGEPVAVDLTADLPDPALAAVIPLPRPDHEQPSEPEPDTPDAESTAEPESAPDVGGTEENEPAPPGMDGLPEAPLDIVEPPEDIEEVRIIVPVATEPEPEPAQEPEPEPEAIEPEPEPEVIEPEPEPEPDTVAAEDPVDEAPTEGAGHDPAPVDDLFARIRAGRAEAVAKAQQVLAEATPAGTVPVNGSAPTVTEEDPGDVALRRRDQALEPLSAQLAKRLKRAMQDEQNDVLDHLRVHKGRPGIGDVLPDPDAQGGRYRDVALPLLVQAAEAGAAAAGDAAAAVDLGPLVADLADAVTGPLRRRLDDGFAAAAREDDDAGATAERVGAAYREWKMQRMERLAADQLAAAYALGGYTAAPAGTAMRWIVHDLDGPCPDCDDNALAGPTPRGEAYPTGQAHPPAHAGCHCLLVPAPST
jgi:DivIVA domain-containing protein